MEQQNQAILTRNLSQPITACVFSKDDLKNLCEILQEWCSKALDEEVKHYSPLNPTPEQLSADVAALKSGFEIKVTVQGIDDERIYGTIPDVFNSPRFPDQVKTLYINSESDLRNLYNWFPRNRFEMLLDFTKPEFFNLSLLLFIVLLSVDYIRQEDKSDVDNLVIIGMTVYLMLFARGLVWVFKRGERREKPPRYRAVKKRWSGKWTVIVNDWINTQELEKFDTEEEAYLDIVQRVVSGLVEYRFFENSPIEILKRNDTYVVNKSTQEGAPEYYR